jgi:hypothetical protein
MPFSKLLGGSIVIVAAVAVLVACEPQEPPQVQEEVAPGFRPDPVDEIQIQVDCEADPIRFVVRPWTAWVQEEGSLRWTQDGPGLVSTRIEAKDPGTWPFDRLPPERPVQAGVPIETGTRKPDARQGIHHYSIFLDCGEAGRFDIDPDIIINGPW